MMHPVLLFSCLAFALASRADHDPSTHMHTHLTIQPEPGTEAEEISSFCICTGSTALKWAFFESRLISTAPCLSKVATAQRTITHPRVRRNINTQKPKFFVHACSHGHGYLMVCNPCHMYICRNTCLQACVTL
jgi:hypothetical protein